MRTAYKVLLKTFEWLLFALFALLVVIVFANVFSRFALQKSLPWAEEMSRFLFVWITFVGAVLVNDSFGHMRLDLLSQTLPRVPAAILEAVVALLATWVMYILLRGGYSMMMDNLDYLSPALEIPYGVVNAIVPLCSGIMMLQAVGRFFAKVREAVAGKEEAE